MIATLGKLPETWWRTFERRGEWLDEETGDPNLMEEKYWENGVPKYSITMESIQERLRQIGDKDVHSEPIVSVLGEETEKRKKLCNLGVRSLVVRDEDDNPMVEEAGVRLEEDEVELLGDLLEKMLKYDPKERITIHEVMCHPWFTQS
jgi:serine/threonine-protein kinase SRPK3